jgi:hypothetical protein
MFKEKMKNLSTVKAHELVLVSHAAEVPPLECRCEYIKIFFRTNILSLRWVRILLKFKCLTGTTRGHNKLMTEKYFKVCSVMKVVHQGF